MNVWARLRTHWRLKLILTFVLNATFWSGYLFLGYRTFFPVRTMPVTWIDTAIPFQSEPWAWIYLSQFLFTGTLPWLIDTKQTLGRYVAGLALMTALSFTVFIFFPVASPHPAFGNGGLAMSLIRHYDGPFNAFPSLHAGFLVYMGLLTWRMFPQALRGPGRWLAASWAAAILYATIATRQHYALDLAAGAAVGLVADWLAWRGSAEDAAAITMRRSKGAASQGGWR